MSPRSPRFSRLSITNQRKSFVESNDDPGKSNIHLEKNLDACQVVETEDEKSVISLLSENLKDDRKITNNSVGSP